MSRVLTQPPGSAPALNRRTVLVGIASTVILAELPAGAAWADDMTVDITAGGDLFDVAASRGSLMQFPRLLGAVITVGSGTVPAGSRVRIAWDKRVYSLQETPLLTSGLQQYGCHQQGRAATNGNITTVTIVIDEDLNSGEEYVLAIGVGRQLRFPHDVIDDPRPMKLTLSTSTSTNTRDAKPEKTPRQTHDQWGAAVSVGWDIVTWGDGFHTWAPGVIVVRSAGPSAVPKNTLVEVRLDRQVFGALRVGPESAGQAVGVQQGQAIVAQYRLPQAVRAGDLLTIPAETTTHLLGEALESLESPTVSVRAMSGFAHQRFTGVESSARTDSAFNRQTKALYGDS